MKKQPKIERLKKIMAKRWVTAIESARLGGPHALSQRCGQLKKAGYKVRDKWVTTQGGSRVKAYTLAKGC
jgi:hypothetical protein